MNQNDMNQNDMNQNDMNQNDMEKVESIKHSLKYIDEMLEVREKINWSRTTYSLKSKAERYRTGSRYISEDCFIEACRLRGLELVQVSEFSYCVNLFDKGAPKTMPPKLFYKFKG